MIFSSLAIATSTTKLLLFSGLLCVASSFKINPPQNSLSLSLPKFTASQIHSKAALRRHLIFVMNSYSSEFTSQPPHVSRSTVTILGFGSLLSERSSRLTFPELKSFRLGRVRDYRRIFRHPASIFFQRGIANLPKLEMSSLCVEPAVGHSFVCSVFEVSNVDGEFIDGEGKIADAFLEREEEFDIISVPYQNMDGERAGVGIICTNSSDEAYIDRWGSDHFHEHYGKYGIKTIWGWGEDSGLKPCSVYLRHCVLASEKLGTECHESFLDETYLVDRKTTVRDYLKNNSDLMEMLPPKDLRERYCG